MYRQYMSPDTNTKQKQLLAWHIIRESSVHAAKEEQVRVQQWGHVDIWQRWLTAISPQCLQVVNMVMHHQVPAACYTSHILAGLAMRLMSTGAVIVEVCKGTINHLSAAAQWVCTCTLNTSAAASEAHLRLPAVQRVRRVRLPVVQCSKLPGWASITHCMAHGGLCQVAILPRDKTTSC